MRVGALPPPEVEAVAPAPGTATRAAPVGAGVTVSKWEVETGGDWVTGAWIPRDVACPELLEVDCDWAGGATSGGGALEPELAAV